MDGSMDGTRNSGFLLAPAIAVHSTSRPKTSIHASNQNAMVSYSSLITDFISDSTYRLLGLYRVNSNVSIFMFIWIMISSLERIVRRLFVVCTN
jgi:hypothetical protein